MTAHAQEAELSASELARRIRRGEIGAREAVAECLARIEERGARSNAFCATCPEDALAQADAADRARARGAALGPLHGVPVAVKDNVLARGLPATAASAVLGDGLAGEAPLVRRLRQAGAIVVGRTNMHEWAYGATNEVSRHGRTCNPWDPRAITGGSSGGSAAAVADGLVPLAIGTDTGGSIRIPAAACGVSGIKPTPGRVSCEGVLPLSWSFDCAGPIAKDAEDLSLALQVMLDDEACARQPAHAAGFRAARDLARPRLGVLQGEGFVPSPAVDRPFRQALRDWCGRGAEIVPVHLGDADAAFAAWKAIMYAEASAYHRQYLPAHGAAYADATRALLLAGESIAAVDYLAAQQWRTVFARQLQAQARAVDALVLPTLPITAPPSGLLEVGFAGRRMSTQDAMTLWPSLANFAGLPAVALPCGFDEQGLPASLTLLGAPGSDFALLGLAASYQDATDWHRARPSHHHQEELHER